MRFSIPDQPTLEGQMLVAAPNLSDPRFDRSVILVLHHGPQGAVGVVLNRPLDARSSEWMVKLQAQLKRGHALFSGGPVDGSVIALQLPKKKGKNTSAGGGEVLVLKKDDQLADVLNKVPKHVRVFVGHAGWTQGQLENEVAGGSWYTLPADLDLLREDRQGMWVEAIRRIGRRFYQDVLGIHEFPDDATCN